MNKFTKKTRRRISAAALTAAALAVFTGILAMTAGASPTVFTADGEGNIYHKETVDLYYDTSEFKGDMTERPVTGSNDSVKITLDRVFCDGENAELIFTAEPADENRKEDYTIINIEISDDPTFPFDSTVSLTSRGCSREEDADANIKRFVVRCSSADSIIRPVDFDVVGTKYIRFDSRKGTRTVSSDGTTEYFGSDENIFRNITLCADIEKNLDIVTLTGENGRTAQLSQLGFFIPGYDHDEYKSTLTSYPTYKPRFSLLHSDGTEEILNCSGTNQQDAVWWSVGDRLEIEFNRLIGLENYIGAKYDDTVYLINNA